MKYSDLNIYELLNYLIKIDEKSLISQFNKI